MDDLDLGASVWGAPSDTTFPVHSSASPSNDQFDDFDDFHTPAQTEPAHSIVHDDDFGDFGDFGDVDATTAEGFGQDDEFGEVTPVSSSLGSTWQPLVFSPLPERETLKKMIDEILEPVWSSDLTMLTTDEDIRQVEGISQVLTTPQSRNLFNAIANSPPQVELLNWTRSRIRQQHLISLGLPVNLDEMHPHANAKPLPPLQISTRPMSAPPGPRGAPGSKPSSREHSLSRAGTPRSGTPQPSSRMKASNVNQLRIGPRPQLDDKKIEELVNLEQDQLTLLPLSKLEQMLVDIRTETTNASSLLTYLLQTRDALEQDSETYNKLIAEMVSEAQKKSTAKGRTSVGKRGTMG